VSDEEATALCYKIFNERINVSRVAELVNDKLAPIAMAVKSGICEQTGDKFWTVVGTTHEEAITIPSEFSNAQRSFLRAIYAEIINAEEGCISSTNCLNLVSTLDTKFSINDADKFIKTVVRRKWLHSKDGFIYIGVRSIVELMPYFRATYADNFHNCFLCHEVVFSGQKCERCDKMYHNYCLTKYTSIQKENKCPHCKHPWDDCDIPADVLNSQTVHQSEDEEAMDVSDETELSQASNVSRKLKKRKRNHH